MTNGGGVKITVCGAGSWGSALASVLGDRHQVRLWNHSVSTLAAIRKSGENAKYLPGVSLKRVALYEHLSEALPGVDLVVVAIPTAFLRAFLAQAKPFVLETDPVIVSVVKGLEKQTNLLVTDIISSAWGRNERERKEQKIVALSGPSHAEEVGSRQPVALTAACESLETAALVQGVFMTPFFRVYTNTDVRGVELGGAVKNVIAIAAGIVSGLNWGANTLAALLTRGLVEMGKIGKALGGRPQTFYGLSGLGDLVATSTSKFSRNRQVGCYLAQGLKLEEIEKKMTQVAEGVPTCRALFQLSLDHQIEMPISRQVYRVLFENKDPKEAVLELMTRGPRVE